MALSSSSQAAARAVAPASVPSPATLSLEITQGRTRFRERPIRTPRFLIGAGATCHLRLGEAGIPPLHSLIVIRGTEMTIEAIARQPQLIVNQQPVETALLQHGDQICIGAVNLRVNILLNTPAATPVGSGSQGPLGSVAELSAAELVDLLEQELDDLDELPRRRETGAQALLQAVASRQSPASPVPAETGHGIPRPHFLTNPVASAPENAAEEELLSELEQVTDALHDLSEELRERSLRASEREATYATATTHLYDAHQKLAAQLETLLSRMEDLKSGTSPQISRKAIA